MTIYVSPNAPEGGTGSEKHPFATLHDAQQALRQAAPVDGDAEEIRIVLLPENVYIGGRCSWPFYGDGTSGRPYLTIDGYPQGYAVHVVEKDRIDSFYRPLMPSGKHIIMVYEPDPRRHGGGQTWDPEGEAGTVRVKLGDEEVEADTVRRRFWVNFETTMTLKRNKDVDEALTVSVEFPDGTYAVHPDSKREWTVRKID